MSACEKCRKLMHIGHFITKFGNEIEYEECEEHGIEYTTFDGDDDDS